jgi:hypothetical protein
MTDLGQALIQRIHSKLQVDEQWTTRTERAFSWIAHRLEQVVSTSRPIRDGEFTLFMLSAETAVVDSVGAPEPIVDRALSDLNRHSFGSCYSFSVVERRIYSTSNTWIHEGTADWRTGLFDTYVIGQLCFAEAEADYLADKCQGQVALRAHPTFGYREQPDDMLNVVDDLIAPKGQEPSRYRNAFEFEGVAEASRRSERVATLGGSAEGIALECSYDDYTAISILNPTYGHRLLGAGLSSCIRLPMSISPEDGYRIAGMLNRREKSAGPIGGQGHLGAWCVDNAPTGGDVVTYRSFLPNLVYMNGLIMDTSMACVARMRWADQTLNAKSSRESAWARLTRRFALGSSEE